jgi:hypothetical protein
MKLEGERICLRPLEPDDADELLRLNVENRAFFAGRESMRGDE